MSSFLRLKTMVTNHVPGFPKQDKFIYFSLREIFVEYFLPLQLRGFLDGLYFWKAPEE